MMSAPTLGYQQAKYLDYGFLAAKAEKAAKALAEKRPLTEEDRAALEHGSEFLKQVAAGAQALTSGNYQVQNLKGAMEAFEVAVDPLEQLGDILAHGDIARALNGAAEAVSSKVMEPQSMLSADQLSGIELYGNFFGSFYNFVRAHISQTNRTPLLGDGGRFERAVQF
jgi:hypothetical protein